MAIRENLIRLCRCFCRQFISFHFKNWHKASKDLILFRILSLGLLLAYSIISTMMYSSTHEEKPYLLKFLHGSRYIGLEIVIILYSSGVVAFGMSIEIYFFVPYVIVNCILVEKNCGDRSKTSAEIIWILKVFCLFVAIELCHRNFRKFPEYSQNFISAARTMLRQTLLFIMTMLFLSSSGLRALYNAINESLPNSCAYEINQCSIIDLYQPTFSYNDDHCSEDLRDFVSGREQLRIVRNCVLLNGASYSVFNKNFFELHNDVKYLRIRILLVILYISLATSVLISNIDPFYFINQCRLIYNIIECIIFVMLLFLPAFNLYNIRHQQRSSISQPRQVIRPLDKSPQVWSAL